MDGFILREELIEQGRRWHELVPFAVILLSIGAYLLGEKWLADRLFTLATGMVLGQSLMRLAGYGHKAHGDPDMTTQEPSP